MSASPLERLLTASIDARLADAQHDDTEPQQAFARWEAGESLDDAVAEAFYRRMDAERAADDAAAAEADRNLFEETAAVTRIMQSFSDDEDNGYLHVLAGRLAVALTATGKPW